MTTIIMNENNTDIQYDSFPKGVTTQYLSKEGEPLNGPQRLEFYTLASYILWVMTTGHSLPMGSIEYSEFAYFAATRPIDKPIELETEYVRRVYTFTN